VLTTHHLEEAEQRCERIAIIDWQDRRGRRRAGATASTLSAARTHWCRSIAPDRGGVALRRRARRGSTRVGCR
jgi:hypothetical protein